MVRRAHNHPASEPLDFGFWLLSAGLPSAQSQPIARRHSLYILNIETEDPINEPARLYLIRVAVAQPVLRLVAALGGAVKPLVHAPKAVQPARIGRIGVVDGPVFEREGAHAGPPARVGRHVGAAHRGTLGPAGARLRRVARSRLRRRRRPVVVGDAPVPLLLLGD